VFPDRLSAWNESGNFQMPGRVIFDVDVRELVPCAGSRAPVSAQHHWSGTQWISNKSSYKPSFWSHSLGDEAVVSNSASFLAVSMTIVIRRCNLFFRSGMFTLSVTRYALPTRST
jgi:hypothetical protein